jgi:hypothetical protein
VDACLKLFNKKGFKFDGDLQAAIGVPLNIDNCELLLQGVPACR